MTSWNGNICRVTGPLCGEFTDHRRIPPHKDQSHGALMFFICAWTNSWANNRDAGDLRHNRADHNVTVIVYMPPLTVYLISLDRARLFQLFDEIPWNFAVIRVFKSLFLAISDPFQRTVRRNTPHYAYHLFVVMFRCGLVTRFYPWLSGLFHWHWGQHTVASVLLKLPGPILINPSRNLPRN